MNDIIIHSIEDTSKMFEVPDTMENIAGLIDLTEEEYSKNDEKYHELECLLRRRTEVPSENQIVLYTIIRQDNIGGVKKIFNEGILSEPMQKTNRGYYELNFGKHQYSEEHESERKESLKVGLDDISLAGQDVFVAYKIDELEKIHYNQTPLSDVLLETWNENSLGNMLGVPLTRDLTGIIKNMEFNNDAVILKLIFDNEKINKTKLMQKAEQSESGIIYKECLALEREPCLDDIFRSSVNVPHVGFWNMQYTALRVKPENIVEARVIQGHVLYGHYL